MSRRHQLMRTPATFAALVVICCAAALALVGCGAGQVTQTDSQVAAVDGASGDIGNIALRDVLIPYPEDTNDGYPIGSDVSLRFTIVNHGTTPDTLLSVSTPAARRVQLSGRTAVPPGTSVTSSNDDTISRTGISSTGTTNGTGSTNSTGTMPSTEQLSPLDVGELRILLVDTTQALRPGLNTDITLVFQNAGQLTLPVPMGPPADSDRAPLSTGGHS